MINPHSGQPRSGRPRRGFNTQDQCAFFPTRAKLRGRSSERAVRVESIGDQHISRRPQSIDEIRRHCRDIEKVDIFGLENRKFS